MNDITRTCRLNGNTYTIWPNKRIYKTSNNNGVINIECIYDPEFKVERKLSCKDDIQALKTLLIRR